jgi:exosortase
MAISLAVWWRPLTLTLALAFGDEQYTHILLILPISATLILLDRKSIWNADQDDYAQSSKPGSRASAAVATVLLVIAVLGTAILRRNYHLSDAVQLATNMLALVVSWISIFLLCFGPRALRRALFPLCFLLLIVPLPELVLNPIVAFLQRGSATAAHLLFALAGFPVAQRGTLLHIPGLTLAVAPECSSIRSSAILLVTTMFVAQLLLRSTWRKVLAITVAIPLSLAKNGLRIFTLGALATRVDPSFLSGRLHHDGGGLFLLIALAVIFLLIWILRRGETQKAKTVPPALLREKIHPAKA